MVQTDHLKSLISDHRVWAGLIVLLALFVGWPTPQSPVVWPDSEAYLAGSPARLPVYSSLARVMGDSYLLICFQFLLSIGALAALGFVVAGIPGLLLGVLLSLAWPVTLWNHTVLSESLSISLFAASLAATFLLVKKWTRPRLIVWCVVIVLYSFTRSTNVFMLPFFIVPFVLRGKRQLVITAGIVALVLVSWGVYGKTVGSSLRETSLLNVYLNRIMHDNTRLIYFVDRGMPVDITIMSFVDRKSASNKEEMFASSPQFAEWFRERGASSYRAWLLSGTLSFTQAWGVMVDNVNYPYPEYDNGMRKRSFSRFADMYYNIVYLPWWLWLAGALAPLVSLLLLKRLTLESLFLPALMAGAYVQAYVGYHGDATEMARHCVLALIGYKTVFLLMIFWLYRLVRLRMEETPAAVPSTGTARRPGRRHKSKRKRSG
jgi:hypothetical protein